jgi:N-alpha-acetyl-L-2,4-diaminobutyrate deacetylase
VRNVLKHAGILDGEIEAEPSIRLDMPSPDCFTFSEDEGLLDPAIDLGEQVRRGDVLARVFPTGRLGRFPVEFFAKLDGVLAARHFPGLVGAGDCLAVVAAVL